MALQNVNVASSAINQMLFDYDEAADGGYGTLVVTFKDDRTYRWESFPQYELETWLQSGSLGQYFNANIRGQY